LSVRSASLLINTQQGVKTVDCALLEVARSFCSTERQRTC
jgi:ABC-type nitrate/sulfonate/bicarbonate transport system permease component